MKPLSVLMELLESIECPIHHQKPEIIKDNDGGLKMTCCCPKFYNECVFLINKISVLLSKE
jgi:hypothetical protein